MPFVSDAQRRWGHSEAGMRALGGPAKVAEWDAATRGKVLPEHAQKLKHAMTKLLNEKRDAG